MRDGLPFQGSVSEGVFFRVENELIITGDCTTGAVVGANCLILPLLHRPFFLVR